MNFFGEKPSKVDRQALPFEEEYLIGRGTFYWYNWGNTETFCFLNKKGKFKGEPFDLRMPKKFQMKVKSDDNPEFKNYPEYELILRRVRPKKTKKQNKRRNGKKRA